MHLSAGAREGLTNHDTTTIPQWICPTEKFPFIDNQRRRRVPHRPDIVIIEGLDAKIDTKDMTKRTRKDIMRTCRITIIEVHYTMFYSYQKSRSRKIERYKPMIKTLISEGWKKSQIKYHVLTFDTLAYRSRTTTRTFKEIGFTSKQTNKMMKFSQDNAIKFLNKQYKCRNRLVHSKK